jgi:hypothetical protein
VENASGDLDLAKEARTNTLLKFNFLTHMGLDILTSPTSLNLREQQQQYHETQSSKPLDPPVYLLLFIQDNISVFGFETSNGVKIIVGLANTNELEELNSLFRSIHKCYIRSVCNPFNTMKFGHLEDDAAQGNVLQSTTFDNNIATIVAEWNNTNSKTT